MSFEKFGIVNYTKESKAIDFVAYLEQGKVMATRCKTCETIYFPPQVDCPKCLLSNMEWFEVKGNGKLLTYSTVEYGPLGFEDKAPYTLAVGEFEDGIKIFAIISQDIEKDEIEVCMLIKVAAAKLPDDRFFFEFEPGA